MTRRVPRTQLVALLRQARADIALTAAALGLTRRKPVLDRIDAALTAESEACRR